MYRNEREGEESFQVQTSEQLLERANLILSLIQFILIGIATISLVVGGIGIMNIMLASVTERTREIGLRKAVGANNFHIMLQFLLESITITLVGGFIGMLGGTLLSYLIALIARFLGYNWAFMISFFSIQL